jgi:glycosyltransferase involved in cell wall biosynthesis
MKIGIYTIALNEAKHVKRFMDALQDADGVFITDTGSTDGTQKMLEDAGARVKESTVNPWRMDVARNLSLDFVDSNFDVAVCVDMDETFQPGWRKKIEDVWNGGVTKIKHPIISTFAPDGVTPEVIFDAERIHARHGYHWKHACHEQTYWKDEPSKQKLAWADAVLEHRPDNAKPRAYLPLLEMMAKEEPESDRAAHYLGRELFFHKRDEEAIREFKRHLLLERSVFDAERASSMRYIAAIMSRQGKQQERLLWLMRACAEAPSYREPWCELGQAYFDNSDHVGCYYAATRAASLTNRRSYHHTAKKVWLEWPHDLIACSAFNMGLHTEALHHAQKAAELAPGDVRIVGNREMIGQFLADKINKQLNPPEMKKAIA